MVLLLAGCSAVYDAQYNDRKAQLEQNRTELLDDSTNVQFITAGEDRFYWIDTNQVAEALELHSVDTRSGTQTDYLWSQGKISVSPDQAPNIAFGDNLIVECESPQAFDADSSSETTSPYPPLGFTDSPCTVAGSAAYVVENPDGSDAAIYQWVPANGSNVSETVALGPINPGVVAFGFADSSHILYSESSNLWLLPLSGPLPTVPLNQQDQTVEPGSVAFDSEGVVFYTSSAIPSAGPVYMAYDTPGQLTNIGDLIGNGGYSLNFEHSDVQDLLDEAAYTIYKRHLIYESKGGIFALGLDTGVVTDILLNGLPDSEDNTTPEYRNLQVTNTGKLFVQDESFLGEVHPVYEVDINALLK